MSAVQAAQAPGRAPSWPRSQRPSLARATGGGRPRWLPRPLRPREVDALPMPVKFGLWRLDGESAQQVRSNVIASEERLEKIIQARLDILGLDDLFQIGRQVITDFGKRIDLLAIDGRGDLYVIELKRDRTPREVVGVPPLSWTPERLGPSGPAGRMWCLCHVLVLRTLWSSVVRRLSWSVRVAGRSTRSRGIWGSAASRWRTGLSASRSM